MDCVDDGCPEWMWLYEDDICAMILRDGEVAAIWAHDDEVNRKADYIQELMIVAMKFEDAQLAQGEWVCRVKREKGVLHFHELDDLYDMH